MLKTIIIKLTSGCKRIGPFTITDDHGNTIDTDISKEDMITGKVYTIADDIINLSIQSVGFYNNSKSVKVSELTTLSTLLTTKFVENNVSALYKHLNVPELFNNYYGESHPYILEHSFSYQYQDEIAQSIKEYTKVFKYLPNGNGVFNNYEKIEVDDVYFNQAILYNGQQNSGILELVPKPKHNLSQYNLYPIYREDSKVILFTKSDNFYNFNGFWNIVKDKSSPQFTTNCSSLSFDKQIDNSNMDYTKRSFKKEPLRAKDLRVRMIYNNSDHHLVSQFILDNTQLSYK